MLGSIGASAGRAPVQYRVLLQCAGLPRRIVNRSRKIGTPEPTVWPDVANRLAEHGAEGWAPTTQTGPPTT